MARAQQTKESLITAAIRLAAAGGMAAATTRAIAREAGVTEGAIYRHYRSKAELRWQAFKQIVEEMIGRKQHLVRSDRPIRERLREWIRLTYEYFDQQPEAFTFVLLMPAPVDQSDSQLLTQQGRMFMELASSAMTSGQFRPQTPALAMSCFTGVMLNVPRLINEGALPGPASQYADDTFNAVWRMMKADDSES